MNYLREKRQKVRFQKGEKISPLTAPVNRHSDKPDEVKNRIEKLMGTNVSKIELFARKKTKDWVSIGEEINGKDIRRALAEL